MHKPLMTSTRFTHYRCRLSWWHGMSKRGTVSFITCTNCSRKRGQLGIHKLLTHYYCQNFLQKNFKALKIKLLKREKKLLGDIWMIFSNISTSSQIQMSATSLQWKIRNLCESISKIYVTTKKVYWRLEDIKSQMYPKNPEEPHPKITHKSKEI